MSTPDPDAFWRRPSDGDPPAAAVPSPAPSEGDAPGGPPETVRASQPESHGLGRAGYQGPPRNVPPPAGWRTPTVGEPHTPRQLPDQDHAVIDAEEAKANTFTYGVGILCGAVLLVLNFVICARVIG